MATARVDKDELSVFGRAAVDYVRMGLAVIPLQPRSKAPATEHGLNDWTDDPGLVRAWWSEHPWCNVGIVCGQPSHGLLVIDVDIDDDVDGHETVRAWEAVNGPLKETVSAKTGSGGMHYLYRVDASRGEIRPSTNHEAGVDIRCAGSYIVAPPSVHPSGMPYAWENWPDEMPIADADGNVLAFVESVQRNGTVDDVTRKPNGKFRLPDRIGEGSRDNTLYRYACHLRAIGRSDQEIENAVAGANSMRCEPPLPASDVRRIVRSACTHPQGDGDDGRQVGKPGSGGQGQKPWRVGKGGKFRHEAMAQQIIEHDHACLIGGAPAIWTGERWAMGVDAVQRRCIQLDPAVTTANTNEVLRHVLLMAPHRDARRDFLTKPYVQFANGTYTVDGERVDPTPDMLITNQVGTEFDPDAECDDVDRFLDSVSAGDFATRRALCQLVCACMCSARLIDQAGILLGYGEGRGGEASNGKSTFLNAVRSMLGGANVSSLGIKMLGQRFQTGHIAGKLVNIGDDIPNGFLTGDELSVFKQIVTGDEVYADVKGAKGFEFTPLATMVFSMNEFPRLGDTSEGVFRRLALIPFRRTFRPGSPDFDPLMGRRITSDAALRRLALLGMRELGRLDMMRRLDPIPDMEAAAESVRTESDSVLRWIYSECVELRDVEGKRTGDVYAKYADWAKASGEHMPVTLTTLSRRLKAFFADSRLESVPQKVDGRVYRVYKTQ